MDNRIIIKLRNIYGVTKAYPASEQAQRLADLVGTKTLTASTLLNAARMGFAVLRVDAYGAADIHMGESAILTLAN